MKYTYIATFLSVFTIFSCNKSLKEINSNALHDTILLKENTILFISPNDKEIKDIKKKYRDDFYTVADDANFNCANAIEYLDSLHEKYSNSETNIVIGYREGKRFIPIPKYRNPWYAILYKFGNYKITDLINFKREYISFFKESHEVEENLEKWYGIYLNSDSEKLTRSEDILAKIGWYKLSIKSNEISFESDKRMEFEFPTESPGGFHINYKCDYKIVEDTIKLYEKINAANPFPQEVSKDYSQPILIVYKKGGKYYGVSQDISESENLDNAIRMKNNSPYVFSKFDK